MSITFNTSATITSDIRDGCVDETNNQALVVVATVTEFRKYDLATGAQNGSSSTVLASPGAVCLLTTASAFVTSTSSTTADLVEISSGYVQNYSGGAVNIAVLKGQQSAGDTASGIAFSGSNTAGQLVKFTASTFTLSTTSPVWLNGQKANTIIFKGSGNFICGTNTGNIIEFDGSANIVKQYYINNEPNVSLTSSPPGTPLVTGLSYDNNMLAVSTLQGMLYCFDHSTGEMIYKQKVGSGSNTTTLGPALCASASGVTLTGYQLGTGSNNTIMELDFTINPITVRDFLYSDITTTMIAFGINSTNNRAFAVQGAATNRKIWFFSVTPRATTTRAVTVQYPSGTNVKADLILYSETNNQVMLDTYMQSPGTYRVPTGHAFKEIVIYGEGASAVYQINRYNL